MVENLFRGHPPGVHPLHPNPFFIRAIREIRGSPLVPLRAGKRLGRVGAILANENHSGWDFYSFLPGTRFLRLRRNGRFLHCQSV